MPPFNLTQPGFSRLPDISDRFRWAEKLLAERMVSLIRKGPDGKRGLLDLCTTLKEKLYTDALPRIQQIPADDDGANAKLSKDFYTQSLQCCKAIFSLAGGDKSDEAAVRVLEASGGDTTTSASLMKLVNAAITTSRSWQD